MKVLFGSVPVDPRDFEIQFPEGRFEHVDVNCKLGSRLENPISRISIKADNLSMHHFLLEKSHAITSTP